MEAGAIVMNPNCSVCLGSCQGVIGENEVLISTGTRNFKGRAGHPSSKVYLGSAATVTASAIKGEIALASDADGVHVGQKDARAMEVRKRLGADKIIGVSARTVEQAKEAEQMGADYLGVGAVFGTTTKGDANKISMEVLKEICESVSIPVVAIGGVCEENILQLKGSGVAGVAVVSGIYAKPNIKESSKKLAELAKEITK